MQSFKQSKDTDDVPSAEAAAFESLFRTHYPALCRFAFRFTGSIAAAEDSVQEVFRVLWRDRERLSVRGNVRAYLYAAVRHRSLNALRTERRESARAAAPSPLNAPDAETEQHELEIVVRDAIRSLPEQARRVVELRWLDGLSYAEIATALDLAPKTVENHLARAKQLLRERLPEDYR